MKARQQTDSFVSALLKHCSGLEIMVLRNPGTQEEAPSSGHVVRSLTDMEKLRAWLWHENASRAGQVYCRPVPGEQHPWLFLDDVARPLAERVASKYSALLIETTPGNCQIRLLAARRLSERERAEIQRELATRAGADLGSTAGSKWGRLPGYKNRKPGRDCWTNLVADTTSIGRSFPADHPFTAANPSPAAPAANEGGRGLSRRAPEAGGGGFREEFSFACHRLSDGFDPGEVIRLVAEHALARGKRRTWDQALRYGEATARKALMYLSR